MLLNYAKLMTGWQHKLYKSQLETANVWDHEHQPGKKKF